MSLSHSLSLSYSFSPSLSLSVALPICQSASQPTLPELAESSSSHTEVSLLALPVSLGSALLAACLPSAPASAPARCLTKDHNSSQAKRCFTYLAAIWRRTTTLPTLPTMMKIMMRIAGQERQQGRQRERSCAQGVQGNEPQNYCGSLRVVPEVACGAATWTQASCVVPHVAMSSFGAALS